MDNQAPFIVYDTHGGDPDSEYRSRVQIRIYCGKSTGGAMNFYFDISVPQNKQVYEETVNDPDEIIRYTCDTPWEYNMTATCSYCLGRNTKMPGYLVMPTQILRILGSDTVGAMEEQWFTQHRMMEQSGIDFQDEIAARYIEEDLELERQKDDAEIRRLLENDEYRQTAVDAYGEVFQETGPGHDPNLWSNFISSVEASTK
jgi:hypothetical protein